VIVKRCIVIVARGHGILEATMDTITFRDVILNQIKEELSRKKCSIWCDKVKVIDLGMDEEKGLFFLDLNEYLKVDQCPVVQRA
jgi:hypothetical protein